MTHPPTTAQKKSLRANVLAEGFTSYSRFEHDAWPHRDQKAEAVGDSVMAAVNSVMAEAEEVGSAAEDSAGAVTEAAEDSAEAVRW
jgi:hypothetical protein